ncbi:MAG: hypothetical protein ACOY5C_11740 [Pseudomonadota bacterium]|uniref:hypothetical protein n=1 Tax=Thermithiobacillus tepidarius TaxID=929 RepID=UPI000419F155|nr:hypothetical protein [Thermithiobacillus tepidarius]
MLTLIAALLLVSVHLFAGKLRFLEGIPRSRWLSAAGGVSVAYVFMHLLPELDRGQEVFRRLGVLRFMESHAYLIALVGLITFYGLERLAKSSRHAQRSAGAADATSPQVFWLHMASFALYNGLVGYLLVHREQPGVISLVLFTVAMALHFVVTDFGLREDHKAAYTRVGRWILAAAIVAGWALGRATVISDLALVVLVAFLAGGVILNVLKEELPEERRSRFSAFLLGAGAYAVLLLAI